MKGLGRLILTEALFDEYKQLFNFVYLVGCKTLVGVFLNVGNRYYDKIHSLSVHETCGKNKSSTRVFIFVNCTSVKKILYK